MKKVCLMFVLMMILGMGTVWASEDAGKASQEQNSKLQDENHLLRNEHVAWQERLRALLGKMEQMGESI